MARFITVAQVGEIPPGEGRPFDAEGTAVAVFHVDGAYYALANACIHKGGPLGEGVLDGHTVTCPFHAWDFDVRTGETSFDLSRQKTFPVRVEGTDIQVDIEG